MNTIITSSVLSLHLSSAHSKLNMHDLIKTLHVKHRLPPKIDMVFFYPVALKKIVFVFFYFLSLICSEFSELSSLDWFVFQSVVFVQIIKTKIKHHKIHISLF